MAEFIVVFERTTYDRKDNPKIEPAYAYKQRKNSPKQRVSGRRLRAGEWGFTRNVRRADRFDSLAEARSTLTGTRLYECLVPDEDGKTLRKGSVQHGHRVIYCPHRFTIHIVRRTPHYLWTDRMVTTSIEVWPKGKAIDALAALV
jgi:hypothetical protein